MTMTDTEAKALALVNAAAQDRHYPIWPSFERSNGSVHEALCRAIEREAATATRHAAELREQAERFSEAVGRALTVTDRRQETHAWRTLSPFIIPAPDPLAEAAKEAGEAIGSGEWTAFAEAQRVALSARGYEVRKIGEAGE